MDIALQRQSVARALAVVETAIARLIDALAHQVTSAIVEGAANERVALQLICSAYASIDYDMKDSVGSSVVCLGVVGVPSEVLKRAVAVNDAKAQLKEVCVPLQAIRTRVPVKGGNGQTKAIPVIRVVLRGIQRSDLNLLAAYRKIPILEGPPVSVTYTRARTRAVYRKSIDEIYDMLAPLEGELPAADRAKLDSLGRQENFLAVVRPHYENIRANILYAHLDRRGRGRMQIGAGLPLLYAIGRDVTSLKVRFPRVVDKGSDQPKRIRQSTLEAIPFLSSIPVFRYMRISRRKHQKTVKTVAPLGP